LNLNSLILSRFNPIETDYQENIFNLIMPEKPSYQFTKTSLARGGTSALSEKEIQDSLREKSQLFLAKTGLT